MADAGGGRVFIPACGQKHGRAIFTKLGVQALFLRLEWLPKKAERDSYHDY
jgi:hypothetical protein